MNTVRADSATCGVHERLPARHAILIALTLHLAATGAALSAGPTAPVPGAEGFDPAGAGAPLTRQEALDRVQALQAEQRFKEAVPFAERAAALAQTEFGDAHAETAAAHYGVGVAYFRAGDLAGAERALRFALSVWERTEESESSQAARTVNNLAYVLDGQGRDDEAESLYRRALDLYDKAVGRTHPEYGTTHRNLAKLYGKLGREAEAETHFREALRAYESDPVENDWLIDGALYDLARFFRAGRRFTDAEDSYRRGLDLRQAKFGHDHPKTIEALTELADLYKDTGRFTEAEPLYRRLLDIGERRVGPDHPDLVPILDTLAFAAHGQGRTGEATGLLARALEINREAFGPDHLNTGESHYKLGTLAFWRGDLSAADGAYREALRIFESMAPTEHPYRAQIPSALGRISHDLGRDDEAQAYFRAALEAAERIFGRTGPEWLKRAMDLAGQLYWQREDEAAETLYRDILEVHAASDQQDERLRADVLERLAAIARGRGRVADAESLLEQALEARAAPGAAGASDDSARIGTLARLAAVRKEQRRFDEAESLYRQALEIGEGRSGPDSPEIVPALAGLADLFAMTGRYEESEAPLRRALAILDGRPDSDPIQVIRLLRDLSEALARRRAFEEGERTAGRAVAAAEAAFGADDPRTVEPLNTLSSIHQARGAYRRAASLQRRILAILEAAETSDPLIRARTLNNLAALDLELDQPERALAPLEEATGLVAKASGPASPLYVALQSRLGLAYAAAGRFETAVDALTLALEIRRRELAPTHPEIGLALSHLGTVRALQGESAAATDLFEQALAIFEPAFGADHPVVSSLLENLALAHASAGEDAAARSLIARALAGLGSRLGDTHPEVAAAAVLGALLRAGDGIASEPLAAATEAWARRARVGRRAGAAFALSERLPASWYRLALAGLPLVVSGEGESGKNGQLAAAFDATQRAHAADAAIPFGDFGARGGGDFGAKDGGPDVALAGLLRGRGAALESWRVTDRLLRASVGLPPERREAGTEAGHRAALAEDTARLDALDRRLAAEHPSVAELVDPAPIALDAVQGMLAPDEALLVFQSAARGPSEKLDSLLDRAAPARSLLWLVRPDRAEVHWIDLDRAAMADAVASLRSGLDATEGRLPRFDLARAHRIYERLLSPAEPLLDGVGHILVVPDGPLWSLPLGLLVTEPPPGQAAGEPDYRSAAWLARRFAITVLPSVSALESLARGPAAAGRRRFVGFADPVFVDPALAGAAGGERPDEPLLTAVADVLGAGPSSLYLREAATAARVRAARLKDFRVLAFAVPTLLGAGRRPGEGPALAFGPSGEGAGEEDGRLTAREIAALELDADWVVLPACRTVDAHGRPNAAGLPVLAKAFLAAGARAVLVSHWRPLDAGTGRLLAASVEAVTAGSARSAAEALHRAQIAWLDAGVGPDASHPAAWAPFSVIAAGPRVMDRVMEQARVRPRGRGKTASESGRERAAPD